jgi:CheY-like chemotaxis protein
MVQPGPPDAGLAPLRILIVDDDRDTTYSTAALLQIRGHVVETALDGTSALSRTGQFVPDLIVLDLLMPDMNGYQVGREIRRMKLPKDPVLAAWSGWSTPKALRECAEAGFDHFMVKPASLSEFDQLTELVDTTERRPSFESLASRFDQQAYTFTRSQLEFCRLVLDAMPYRSDKGVRQRQIVRLYRTITLAEAWLTKQRFIPEAEARSMETEVAHLRARLASASADAFP